MQTPGSHKDSLGLLVYSSFISLNYWSLIWSPSPGFKVQDASGWLIPAWFVDSWSGYTSQVQFNSIVEFYCNTMWQCTMYNQCVQCTINVCTMYNQESRSQSKAMAMATSYTYEDQHQQIESQNMFFFSSNHWLLAAPHQLPLTWFWLVFRVIPCLATSARHSMGLTGDNQNKNSQLTVDCFLLPSLPESSWIKNMVAANYRFVVSCRL